jgi:hypothetical protein
MVVRILVNSEDSQEMRTFRGYIEENFQFYSIFSDCRKAEVTVFGSPGELSLSLQSLRTAVNSLLKEITQNV